MTENELLASCLIVLRAELPQMGTGVLPVILKHNDGLTSGVPDVSITWRKKTSWWEFKHGPKIKWAHKLQQLTCRRLAAIGICYVVLYEEKFEHDSKHTCILTPDEVLVEAVEGFDHRFVLDYVWRTHAA